MCNDNDERMSEREGGRALFCVCVFDLYVCVCVSHVMCVLVAFACAEMHQHLRSEHRVPSEICLNEQLDKDEKQSRRDRGKHRGSRNTDLCI